MVLLRPQIPSTPPNAIYSASSIVSRPFSRLSVPSRRSPFNSARVHRLHLTVPIQRQAHLSFRSSLGSICLVFRLPRAILCDESSSSANLHRPFLFHTLCIRTRIRGHYQQQYQQAEPGFLATQAGGQCGRSTARRVDSA